MKTVFALRAAGLAQSLRFVAWVVAFSSGSWATAHAQDGLEPEGSALPAAWQTLEAGDLPGARALFEAARTTEHQAEALTGLAAVLAAERHWLEAVGMAEQALVLDATIPLAQMVVCSGALILDDLVRASQACNQAAILAPQRVEAWEGVCTASVAQQDWSRAIVACESGLALDAQSVGLRWRLGLSLVHTGRNGEGRSVCEDLLRTHPDEPMAYYCVGVSHLMARRHGEAAATCAQGRQRNDSHALLWYCEGMAALTATQMDKATADCEHAVELAPQEALGHYCLGQIATARADYDAARQHYERAMALNARLAEARSALGDMLSLAGQLAEGEQVLRAALEMAGDSSDAHMLLGQNLLLQERYDEAWASFEEAVQLNPDNTVAVARQGQTRQAQGRVTEAVERFQHAAALQPHEPLWPRMAIEALLVGGDVPAGLALADETLRRFPGDVALLTLHCQAAMELRDWSITASSCARAQSAAPESAAPLLALAMVAMADQDGATAESLLERSVALQAPDAVTLFNLGLARLWQEDFGMALQAFEQSQAVDPTIAMTAVGRAQALEGLGRTDEARDAWCTAIRLDPSQTDWHRMCAEAVPR